MARALAVFALATAAQAGQVGNFLKSHLGFEKSAHEQGGMIRALEFKHQLRVCNAYPYTEPMDVYMGDEQKLTTDGPMAYKACRDFEQNIKAGDKLEFKIGEARAGSFAVSQLPDNDAVLLLVIHRHDPASTAVSFESHVFGNNESPQLAVIDTYKGMAQAVPRIKDEISACPSCDPKDKKHHAASRSEELRYSSVVAVSEGKYDVELAGPAGDEVAKSGLVALKHNSYVVLRTGVESTQGESYPEELIVFPQSDPGALHKSAAASSFVTGGVATLVASVFAVATLV